MPSFLAQFVGFPVPVESVRSPIHVEVSRSAEIALRSNWLDKYRPDWFTASDDDAIKMFDSMPW